MLIALITLILFYGLKKNIIPQSFYNKLQHLTNNKHIKIFNNTAYKPVQAIKTIHKPKLNKTHPLKIPKTQKPCNGNLKI